PLDKNLDAGSPESLARIVRASQHPIFISSENSTCSPSRRLASHANSFILAFKFFERRHAFPQFAGTNRYSLTNSFKSFLIHPPPHQLVLTYSLNPRNLLLSRQFV